MFLHIVARNLVYLWSNYDYHLHWKLCPKRKTNQQDDSSGSGKCYVVTSVSIPWVWELWRSESYPPHSFTVHDIGIAAPKWWLKNRMLIVKGTHPILISPFHPFRVFKQLSMFRSPPSCFGHLSEKHQWRKYLVKLPAGSLALLLLVDLWRQYLEVSLWHSIELSVWKERTLQLTCTIKKE